MPLASFIVRQELVMTFELPKVSAAAAIDLDITEHGVELTVSCFLLATAASAPIRFRRFQAFSMLNTAFPSLCGTAKPPLNSTKTSKRSR